MKKLILLFLLLLFFAGNTLYSQVHPDTAFNSLLRKNNGGWIAGDATFSIALPDQRTLWLFGDSFIGTVNSDSSIAPGSHFIRNCAVLQDGDSMRSLYNGTFASPDAFLPSPDPDSLWYWPEHGLVENDTLKIFFSEFIISEGVPGFNFKYTGAYVARFSYPEIEFLDKVRLPYFDMNHVCYGNSVMVDNGYTYIYGRNETDSVYSVSYPHVARVPVGNIMAPWQFYNGNGWSDEPADTYRIGNVAVSQQYGFFKQDSKYVLLTQEIWLSTKIYSYTCNTPGGPLNNKVLLYQTPVLYPGSFTYNAFPHIQFTSGGELLVSYNTNGDFWQIFSNVELYRPLFIRVPLTLIDPGFTTGMKEIQPDLQQKPIRFYQNIPNPVESVTQIKFELSHPQFVSLELRDMLGRTVRSYINRELQPGTHTVSMDLHSLKSGLYCYGTGQEFLKLLKN